MFGSGEAGSAYNFTDRVRGVLAAAKTEALRLGVVSAGPEHILLGLIGDRDCVAMKLLRELGVGADLLLERLEARKLIQRYVSPKDKRVKLLRLTSAGAALTEHAEAAVLRAQ